MFAAVDLSNPIFTGLEAIRTHFEAIRLGCYGPLCGSFDHVAPLPKLQSLTKSMLKGQ